MRAGGLALGEGLLGQSHSLGLMLVGGTLDSDSHRDWHIYFWERDTDVSRWAGSRLRAFSKTVLGLLWATRFMRTAFHCSHLLRGTAHALDLCLHPLPSAPPQHPLGLERSQKAAPAAHLMA